MKKPNVLGWLKQSWTKIVDPAREPRITEFVSQVHRHLSAERQSFDFQATADKIQIPDEERQDVREKLFTKCVAKAWSDGELSESETRSLKWVGGKIGLQDDEIQRLMVDRALDEFERVFCNSLFDGHIDEDERLNLEHVANACGTTSSMIIQARFRDAGEAFIRNMFVNSWNDGRIDADEWNAIRSSMELFGMSQAQFCASIQHPARQMIEHLLADFQSDGLISKNEEKCIEWMLSHLVSDKGFSEYVRGQIRETMLLADIVSGKLPTLGPVQGVGLRAGEIVHFNGSATYYFARRTKKTNELEAILGVATITDDRFIFVSADRSFQILHTKVLGYTQARYEFEVQCSGKGAGSYDFKAARRLASAIWSSAIGKANQTIVAPREEQSTRHIPRDVRQRVWQKYGGRCAECNAEDYLEFDHIVPVARGGSNSENNVQLLCRRCNLTKSDAI